MCVCVSMCVINLMSHVHTCAFKSISTVADVTVTLIATESIGAVCVLVAGGGDITLNNICNIHIKYHQF